MNKTFGKISRKAFFNHLALLLSAPLVFLAFNTVFRAKRNGRIKELRIPIELDKDIVFHKDIIYVNQNNKVKFFSSKCTHLGCKINTLKNDFMACGCHGSHFALDGKVLKGPASRNLVELNYSIDQDSQEYVIKLS
jgi:Rieske Fe-S protein